MPKRAVGQAARDGSAAHAIAELCLNNGQNAAEYVDRGMDIGDGKGKVFLDDEDCAAVQIYIDHVRTRKAIPGATHYVEYQLSMKAFSDDPLLSQNGGTADSLTLDWANRVLYVDDLKFGKGVMVKGDSYQLQDYALMAALTFPHPEGWSRIITTIIQPRAEDENERFKSVEHSPEKLQDFLFLMYGAFRASQDPNTPLNPGEKQCQWCDGKGRPCPALAKRTLEIAKTIFEPVNNAPVMLSAPVVTAPEGDMGLDLLKINEATPAQLAAWKEKEEMVDAFFKGVSHRIAALSSAGIQVPGWKMVARAGNRKFLEPDALEELQKKLQRPALSIEGEIAALGVPAEQQYGKPKRLSPAQIEKKISKASKKDFELLYEKPMGDATLVRDADSRGALPGVFSAVPQLPSP